MRVLKLAFVGLLIGAAPIDVPIGRFQTWNSFEKRPAAFISGGVSVRVEALPCPAQPDGDSSCRWEGYNNQAAVTVSAPGVVPRSITTDRQSAYVRIAVVRFRESDSRPGLIIESQYGGSGGDMRAQLVMPSGNGYRVLPMDLPHGQRLQGEIANAPRDLSGDGRIDLKLEDGSFESVFGCNACTPRPPRLFTVKDGKLVDESRDPALRIVFATDMARLAPICLSKTRYRNGACAAYIADAARAGQFKMAWAAMLQHYEPDGNLWEPCDVQVSALTNYRCPEGHITHFKDFPASLRAFLMRTGYLPA
ncbi:hypothetical protein [Sphingomonas mollis]|uniref:Uncharacterized protein n=1 Tax=Sphingomonas mollis TaxID=2795726 RepID=A0ABS0XRQ9_9SPHN|nr:hypothetical protein [Sphingomonas sp. BT553]MBJ6122716.1 hypothetical protein [Sphingomonas sp. BT553]